MGKLTDAQVHEILALLGQGIQGKEIAKRFNVSKNTVSEIKRGTRIPYSRELIKRGTPNPPATPENKKRFARKLSDDDARKIKKRFAAGDLVKDIAKDYGVSIQTISYIRRGITFKHVK